MPPLATLSLNQPPVLNAGAQLVLALGVLAIAVASAIFLFIVWNRNRQERRFLLFWSLGLFLTYLFQIPFILAAGGVGFVLSDFSLFFSITIPASFLGIVLVYSGLLEYRYGCDASCRERKWVMAWSALAFVYFAVIFFGTNSYIRNHVWAIAAIGLFFMPIFALKARLLWRWFTDPLIRNIRSMRVATGTLLFATLLQVAGGLSGFIVILEYPPAFWFIALLAAPLAFLLQSLNTLLFVAGFLIAHRHRETGL